MTDCNLYKVLFIFHFLEVWGKLAKFMSPISEAKEIHR